MTMLRLILIAAVVYVIVVVAFESLLGVFQPASDDTVVITTTDEEGSTDDRVVSGLESGGQLFVAANHWPRAWYERALRNPEVEVMIDGVTHPYRAVPATEEEHRRVASEHPLGLPLRIVTGFPPRRFLRLDPR